MNLVLRTVIVAPLTHTIKRWPSRLPSQFGKSDGEIALDQIRAVDKTCLLRRLGRLKPDTARAVSDVLVEMFAWGEE
jgi:mRNA interferase MazF